MLLRKFILSCDIFSGYECELDMDYVENVDEIITHVLDKLTTNLRSLKLFTLQNKLTVLRSSYHIHDHNFGDILLNPADYYICSHGEVTVPMDSQLIALPPTQI